MAVSAPRSRAARVRRFWLKVAPPVDATSYQTVILLSGMMMDTDDRPPERQTRCHRPPPPTTTTERLADYEQRYRELAAQLATIGLIHSGSVTRRYTRCATPGCKCHAEPPQPHGPYYQWTAKNNGKTVTRRLTEAEAELYQEWIANGRRLRRLIAQMRQVAAKAAELKLTQAANP